MTTTRFTACALLLGSVLLSPLATAQNCLTTLFSGTTSTSSGRTAALVDVSVTASVIVQSIACNFATAGVPITLEVWTTPGTWVNNQATQALWTLQSVDTGGVVTATPGQPTTFTLATPFQLTPGSYGVYLIANGASSHRYSSGGPLPYTDGTMTITTGAMDTTPFNGTANLNPRQWNGTICYQFAMGIFANFTADQTQVGPGDTVNFTDTTFSSDPGGVIAWSWDLDGDGTLGDSTVQNPSFVYGACGPVSVTLMATDAVGSSTLTRTGYINVTAPVASFTYTPLGGTPPIPVQFTSTSTADGPGAVYDWDLDGDGVYESLNAGPNPIGVFPSEGLFPNIGLTVTNPCGMNSTTRTVDTRQGLCTTFIGGNGLTATGAGAGNMFDINVLNPAGITVTALAGNLDSAGASVSCEVYITPGTYVGNFNNAGVWTLTSTGTGTAAGAGLETALDVRDFCLAPGSYGMFVRYITSAGGVDYTNGTGTNQMFANADFSLSLGVGVSGLFPAAVNDPRVWNGCIFYRVGQTAGTYTQVSVGGCPASTGSIINNAFTGGGVPAYGQPFSITISNAPANENLAGVLLGFYDVGGLPLDIIGMTGCLMHADGVIALLSPTSAAGVGVTAPFGIPNDPLQFGASIWTQPISRDIGVNPFGAVTGHAFRATVGCP